MTDVTARSAESGTALPQAGDRLGAQGRYRLDGVIGKGGFGAVYAARDMSLNRDVAVKVLHRNGNDDDGTVLARFLREAQATASLDSEHLATIHEVGVSPDGHAFIVMERLKGADLANELARRGRIPLTEAVDWILQASLGLAHAHAAGVVHRDLKPQNLFLVHRADGTSIVKILDFGIAKSASGAGNESLTQSGTLLGTPRYMAPEQIRNVRDVDARADLWALGVVLYELTTGSPIFDADGSAAFAGQILVDPHVPLRTRAPDLPETFEAIVDRCLAKDVKDRPRHLVDLAHALASFSSAASESIPRRIERVLHVGANDPTVRAPLRLGAAADADADADAAASTSSKAAGAAGAAGTTMSIGNNANVERSIERSSVSAATSIRRSPTVAIAAGVAIGLSIIGAVYLSKDRPSMEAVPDAVAMGASSSAPTSTATATATTSSSSPMVSASAATPAATSVAMTTTPTPSVVAVVVTAPSPKRSATQPAQGSGPTPSEVDRIKGACDSRSPTFLVEGNDGPAQLQYHRLAALGCSGIRSRCATVPITNDEKVQCRDFLGSLKAREICL